MSGTSSPPTSSLEVRIEGQTLQTVSPALFNQLPTDIISRIFSLLLSTSYQSPVDDNSASNFFACAAPNNIARVCRSWRDFVLSSPSLWSSFFLWVSSPSNQTLKAMKTYIERHLKRSGTLPLTCFVRLDGRYDKSLSRDIATTIAAHLSRWRRMEFWFDVDLDIRRHDAAAAFDRQQDDEPVVDTVQTEEHLVPVPPPHTINLFTEELGLLEDLRLNLRTRYDIVGRSLQTPGLLSLLERLDLDLPEYRCDKVVKWLDLAPNIKELNLGFGPNGVTLARGRFVSPDFLILEKLQILRIRSSPYRLGGLIATGFLLRNFTCRALTELRLLLVDIGTDLFNFVHRSMPPLRVLNLELIHNESTTLEPEQVADTLALIPTISELKLEVLCSDDFQLAILNILSRTCNPADQSTPFSLLPVLETLELGSFNVSVVELIAARWRCSPPRTTLKSVTLSGRGHEDQASLVGFKPGDDLVRLPARWNLLKECVTEGLRFSITQ